MYKHCGVFDNKFLFYYGSLTKKLFIGETLAKYTRTHKYTLSNTQHII